MTDPDDLIDLHSAAMAVQEAIGVLVERLEVLLPEPELEPESEPVPDAERFKAEVPAEPTRRLTVDLPREPSHPDQARLRDQPSEDGRRGARPLG